MQKNVQKDTISNKNRFEDLVITWGWNNTMPTRDVVIMRGVYKTFFPSNYDIFKVTYIFPFCPFYSNFSFKNLLSYIVYMGMVVFSRHQVRLSSFFAWLFMGLSPAKLGSRYKMFWF